MWDLFSEIKSTILKQRSVYIDNVVFRLHWLITSSILMVLATLLTARQYVAHPIDCLIESSLVPPSMINTYCWISQTFLIPSTFNEQIGIHVPHPGVSNSRSYYRPDFHSQYPNGPNSNLKYYPYYQWICFVLLLQGFCFYIPHYMWKSSEGGIMRTLSADLKVALTDYSEKPSRPQVLANYLVRHFRMFNSYAYKYCFFEFVCLFNAISQFFLTDLFLDGHFFWYGVNVVNHTRLVQYWFDHANSTEEALNTINPLIFPFPRMTKCIFHYFGASGDIQRKDALCLLPLNVFHEKIYLFLWFWFSIIIILSILVLFIRIIMIVIVQLRPAILKSRCKFCSSKHLRVICKKGNFGDFFIFYFLSKNLDPIVLQEVVYEVSKQLIKQDTYVHSTNQQKPRKQHKPYLSGSLYRTSSLDRIYKPIDKYEQI